MATPAITVVTRIEANTPLVAWRYDLRLTRIKGQPPVAVFDGLPARRRAAMAWTAVLVPAPSRRGPSPPTRRSVSPTSPERPECARGTSPGRRRRDTVPGRRLDAQR